MGGVLFTPPFLCLYDKTNVTRCKKKLDLYISSAVTLVSQLKQERKHYGT